MAGPSNLINLDSLISDLDNDDDKVVLKISEDAETLQTDRNDDSGSDSSYGELANKTAIEMERLIAEMEMEQEEKTRRIAAARHEKAKELEEKQKSFGHGKNVKKPPKNANEKIPKVYKEKNLTPKEKNSIQKEKNVMPKEKNPTQKENNTPPKDKKPKRNNNLCKSVINEVIKSHPNVDQVSSKMKNVTIQNFEIESSPSESDKEESNLDLEKYNKMLSGYQKSFTVKSLNRIEKEVSSSSEDDEDSGILDKNLPRFVSAEKSAAAHRRKRSNYMKKRHSNYKKDDAFALVQVTEGDEPNSSNNTPQSNPKDCTNPSKNKNKNDRTVKKNQIKEENNSANLDKNTEQFKILKKPKKTTKVFNNDSKKDNAGANYSPKGNPPRKNKFEKNYDNFEQRSMGKPDKPTNIVNNNSGAHSSKDKVSKRSKYNSFTNEPSKSGQPIFNGVDSANTSKDDLGHCSKSNFLSNDQNHLSKSVNESPYLSSDDSIQIIKEVSLVQNKKDKSPENDSECVFKFERSPLSSENEIDWKAVDELRFKTREKASISYEDPDSDEELGNDLLSIVKKHSRLVKELSEIAKIEKPAKELNDISSSDLEAEFDAVLEQFDKIK